MSTTGNTTGKMLGNTVGNTVGTIAGQLVGTADSHPFTAEPQTRLERTLAWLADHSNPILVKELRQAIKSRQFFWTFFLMLIFIVGWSFLGLALSLQSYTAVGAWMMMGYFMILSFPLVVVVPFSAFRSLAREYEDETIQLMRITTMSAQQIVWGKLFSAMAQMSVYFFGVVPCLMFAYLLQGVELAMVGLLLSMYFFGSIFLTSLSLLCAGMTRNAFFRVTINLALIIGLFISFISTIGVTGGLLENAAFGQMVPWDGMILYCVALIGAAWVCIQSTLGLISFAAENRSTRIRVALLAAQVAIVALLAASPILDGMDIPFGPLVYLIIFVMASYWTFLGSMMGSERSVISHRSRRGFPKSWWAQSWQGLLMPGPGRGYLLAVAQITAWCGVAVIAAIIVDYNSQQIRAGNDSFLPFSVEFWTSNLGNLTEDMVLACGFNWFQACFYLSLAYWLNWFYVRRTGKALGPGFGLVALTFCFAIVHIGVISVMAWNELSGANNNTEMAIWNWWFGQALMMDNGTGLSGLWFSGKALVELFTFLAISSTLTVLAILHASRELSLTRLTVPDNVISDLGRRAQLAEEGESFDELIRQRQSLIAK